MRWLRQVLVAKQGKQSLPRIVGPTDSSPATWSRKPRAEKSFEGFRAGLMGSLQPLGELEVLLVDRIAACAWRLRRVARIETESFAPVVSYSSKDLWFDDEDEEAPAANEVPGATEAPTPPETNRAACIPDHLQVGYTEKDGDTETVVVEHEEDEDRVSIHIKSTNRSPARAFDKRGETFERLSRYERAIENSLFRTLHELQRLQAARQGASVAVPVVLDVAIAGASRQR